MKNVTCNFFAMLKDDTVRKIDLLQTITADIRNVFINNGNAFLNEDVEEILFDGNFNIQDEEILYVEFELPENVAESSTNPIGLKVLNLATDDIKALFWVEDEVYYFQNFDKRKLLQNKNVIFWDKDTFDKFTNNALIVDNMVNAIYINNRFYFKSYANANKIFSLISFFEAASDEVIDQFATNGTLTVDANWLKENADTIIKKQITLIQNSNILTNASPKKIKSSANKFNLKIQLVDRKLILPNDKKQCKDILSFLNEQYYFGLITGNKFRTNSKREA
ncbi:DUF4868 domain-containing protein [Lacihabitans sp. CCS-44]|uniref:Kiwa anti-phage protein KwaB-like domain-containing protein n=1 Tax=Lacihabitans sp. CCS-44 TaxID=2487331 RepID=UPI0020CFB0DC|nr:Kiwa anti-phage protein KwaB-like domain-containing protein [Lacihabitans sp. CCS-44]MCP9757248.1 DUF4868 domain-containing protein [Lacihabitans sp. CCS-44]